MTTCHLNFELAAMKENVEKIEYSLLLRDISRLADKIKNWERP